MNFFIPMFFAFSSMSLFAVCDSSCRENACASLVEIELGTLNEQIICETKVNSDLTYEFSNVTVTDNNPDKSIFHVYRVDIASSGSSSESLAALDQRSHLIVKLEPNEKNIVTSAPANSVDSLYALVALAPLNQNLLNSASKGNFDMESVYTQYDNENSSDENKMAAALPILNALDESITAHLSYTADGGITFQSNPNTIKVFLNTIDREEYTKYIQKEAKSLTEYKDMYAQLYLYNNPNSMSSVPLSDGECAKIACNSENSYSLLKSALSKFKSDAVEAINDDHKIVALQVTKNPENQLVLRADPNTTVEFSVLLESSTNTNDEFTSCLKTVKYEFHQGDFYKVIENGVATYTHNAPIYKYLPGCALNSEFSKESFKLNIKLLDPYSFLSIYTITAFDELLFPITPQKAPDAKAIAEAEAKAKAEAAAKEAAAKTGGK